MKTYFVLLALLFAEGLSAQNNSVKYIHENRIPISDALINSIKTKCKKPVDLTFQERRGLCSAFSIPFDTYDSEVSKILYWEWALCRHCGYDKNNIPKPSDGIDSLIVFRLTALYALHLYAPYIKCHSTGGLIYEASRFITGPCLLKRLLGFKYDEYNQDCTVAGGTSLVPYNKFVADLSYGNDRETKAIKDMQEWWTMESEKDKCRKGISILNQGKLNFERWKQERISDGSWSVIKGLYPYQTPEEIKKVQDVWEKERLDRAKSIVDAATKPAKKALDELWSNMVMVKGGTFTMGCTSEQGNDCDTTELPAHQVTLNGFYINKYEVTNALYYAVMGHHFYNSLYGEEENPTCLECPAEFSPVTGNVEIADFIKELNKLTGKNYRMPTEAEWEYAARGGNQSRGYKFSGSNDVTKVAWWSGDGLYGQNETADGWFHKVGTKTPNELGIYDMSGNIPEMCSDYFNRDYYEKSPASNPKGASYSRIFYGMVGPSYVYERVLRGGAGLRGWQDKRVSARDYLSTAAIGEYLGLRLAHDY